MSHATVESCTLAGLSALPVIVEVHTGGGLPAMSIVGLPQSAVRESKDRVRAAIEHVGLSFPQVRVIVNLAPADLPKQGGRFDLPIAIALLIATGQLPPDAAHGLVIIGELGLTGEVRPVTGVLPTALFLANGNRALLLPASNAAEAARARQSVAYGTESLMCTVEALRDRSRLVRIPRVDSTTGKSTAEHIRGADMRDVIGQHQARRALEIAAAGGHNLLMTGPPGTGKSMLASRLPGLLPGMTEEEAMQSASVRSITFQGFDEAQWGVRPFRAPHHTASGVALVGGGSRPMPGEISLAHHGVLFLDELPEFSRAVLDVLREPLESGAIAVSRAARQAEFPARFQLIAAMNPCPCGYHGDPDHACRCTPDQVLRYRARVSGPLLDRIDLHLFMARLAATDRRQPGSGEPTEYVRDRVRLARERQIARQGVTNAVLPIGSLPAVCRSGKAECALLEDAAQRLCLSVRSMHRLQRVARTIADLDGAARVERAHLAEALSYRRSETLV